MTLQDLLLFSGAVYGAAWVLTKSKLTALPRSWIKDWWFVGPLSQCVVCTSAWVSFALCWLIKYTTVFSASMRPQTPVDFAVLVSWSVCSSWVLGYLLKDAD